MNAAFVIELQKPDAGRRDDVAQVGAEGQGPREDREDFRAQIVGGDAVDVDTAAAGTDMHQHQIAAPFPSVFVDAVQLEGQADRRHARVAQRGPVSGAGVDVKRMKTIGAMIAVRRAHGRVRKHHPPALGAAECAVGCRPSVVCVCVGFAYTALVGAEPLPPEITLIVEHGFMPFISNQMIGQNEISGDVRKTSLPARSTGADSGGGYERLINAQDDRSAKAISKADAALGAV